MRWQRLHWNLARISINLPPQTGQAGRLGGVGSAVDAGEGSRGLGAAVGVGRDSSGIGAGLWLKKLLLQEGVGQVYVAVPDKRIMHFKICCITLLPAIKTKVTIC